MQVVRLHAWDGVQVQQPRRTKANTHNTFPGKKEAVLGRRYGFILRDWVDSRSVRFSDRDLTVT
jgi:hypothetical protein